MANSIREYLEKGRAGKQFDVEKNMWIDPQTGQAFIPTFTNIQGNEGFQAKPYKGGQYKMGEPTIDPQTGGPVQQMAEYAGGDPNVSVERRPPMMVAPEEGVRIGPQGVPVKPAMQQSKRPDPNDPAAMAYHVVDTMVKKGEFNQILGIKPGQKVDPESYLGKLRQKMIGNTLKQMTDHYAIRLRATQKSRKEKVKKSGLTTKQFLEEMRERGTDRLGRQRPREEVMKEIMEDLDAYREYTGDAETKAIPKADPQVPGLNQPGGIPYKGQPKVVGQVRQKTSGKMVDIYDDGTAIINGKRVKVPANILQKMGVKRPAPRPSGDISPIPKAGTDAQSSINASVGAGQPTSDLTVDKFRQDISPSSAMWKQYAKR